MDIVYDEPENSEGLIRNDKDICAHCNQQGHQQEDCDTPMRSFQHCPICAWTKNEGIKDKLRKEGSLGISATLPGYQQRFIPSFSLGPNVKRKEIGRASCRERV